MTRIDQLVAYGVGGGHHAMAGGFLTNEAFPSDRSIDTYTRVRAAEFVERAMLP
jgi:hypothetical protein